MTSSGRRSSESRAKRRLTVDRQSWIQNPNKKLESFAQPLPPRTGLWHIPGYMQQSVNDNPTSYTHQHKLGGPPNLLPTCPEDVLDAGVTYVGPSYWRRPLAIGFSHLMHRVN